MEVALFVMDDGIGINHFENIIENLIRPDRRNIYRRRAIIKHRNREYYEKIIPRFTGDQFKEMFRMNRATCEVSNYKLKLLTKLEF